MLLYLMLLNMLVKYGTGVGLELATGNGRTC